jgi:hypothetical protein
LRELKPRDALAGEVQDVGAGWARDECGNGIDEVRKIGRRVERVHEAVDRPLLAELTRQEAEEGRLFIVQRADAHAGEAA